MIKKYIDKKVKRQEDPNVNTYITIHTTTEDRGNLK